VFKVKSAMAVSGAAILMALLGSSAAHAAPPPADESRTGNVIDLGGGFSTQGNCTDIGIGELCGTVKNHSNSDTDLWVINNWPPETANGAFARPGESSKKYFKDTDGFYVPSGCKGKRSLAPDLAGGYWYKIPDTFNSTVEIVC
jgi:hypothetical protein